MNERKPGAAFFVTMFLVASVLAHPVTFGVAVWLAARGYVEPTTVQTVYQPIVWAAVNAPEPVDAAVYWWGSLGLQSDEGVVLFLPTSEGGNRIVCFGRPPFALGRGASGAGFILR